MAKKKTSKKGRKNAKKGPRFNYPLVLGAAALLLAIAWLFYPTYMVRVQQEKQLSETQRQLDLLERENAELKKRIGEMKRPEYIEQYAREKLALVKPGEKAYVVLPPNRAKRKPRPKLEETASAEPTGTLSAVSRFFKQLFGR